MKRIILATKSEHRAKLFQQMKLDFDVVLSTQVKFVDASNHEQLAHELALIKAKDVLAKNPEAIVIGAQTIISSNSELILKPKDKSQAFAMLKHLQGRQHRVITSVAVVDQNQQLVDFDDAFVRIQPMTDEQITYYLNHPQADWEGKTGAYNIQGLAGQLFISNYIGNYNAAAGLPLKKCREMLKRFGIESDVPESKLAVVDDKNQFTGKIKDFLTIHEHGDWHRKSVIYVLNRDKEILCQKRASHLFKDPGQWQPYVGGHVNYDERPIETALHEVKDEIGLQMDRNKIKVGPIRKSPKDKEWIYSFIYVFLGKMEDLRFVDKEVEEITFLPFDRILSSMKKDPARWASRVSSLKLMKSYLK